MSLITFLLFWSLFGELELACPPADVDLLLSFRAASFDLFGLIGDGGLRPPSADVGEDKREPPECTRTDSFITAITSRTDSLGTAITGMTLYSVSVDFVPAYTTGSRLDAHEFLLACLHQAGVRCRVRDSVYCTFQCSSAVLQLYCSTVNSNCSKCGV